jgi:hypothetical protein
MKISLDAAMRARDVSAPSAADDLAADDGAAEPVTAGTGVLRRHAEIARASKSIGHSGSSDSGSSDNSSASNESNSGDSRPVGDRIPDRPRPPRRPRLRHGQRRDRPAS